MGKILKILRVIIFTTIFLLALNLNIYANDLQNITSSDINDNYSNEIMRNESNIEITDGNNIQSNVQAENVNTDIKINEIEEDKQQLDNIKRQAKAVIQGEELIADGTTNRITTKLSGRTVGIDGGKYENGANVNLWDDIDVSQQRFIFQYSEDGYYKIINEKSGKLLDVIKSDTEGTFNVDQWEDNGGNENQKWIIKDAGEGYYNIISAFQGLYLTVNGNGENNDLLCVKNSTGEDNQKFQIVEKGTPKGEKTVEDGIYKIVLAVAPTQSLTVDSGKQEDGANVHIWEYVFSPQQQFKLLCDENGYYEIIPMHSGKRLDVAGNGNEANVEQWSDNGGNDNQRWVIRKNNQGNYNIISKRKALYLDAYEAKTENGTNVQVYEQSRGAGQEFKLEKLEESEIVNQRTVEDGTYKIVLAVEPTQSLTVDGGKQEDGVNVHIWEYINSLQQQFNIMYDGYGYYEIIPVHSGKRLDVVGYGNEANVDQWSSNGGNDNQKWKIIKSESGNYNIISKRQGLYLDAYEAKTENGTNIQVYEKSGGAGQEFKLEKIEDKIERKVQDGIYKIKPKENTNIVVEASASNTDNNGRIQIWQDFNAIAQKLNLEYKDGFYKISMRHTGKSLTVKDGVIKEGVDIVQYDYQGLDSQKWVLRNVGGDSWVISLLKNPDLSISIDGNISNGDRLILSKTEENNNQLFYISNITEIERPKVDGIYKIAVGEDLNKAIEVAGGNQEQNAMVGIWDYGSAEWQKFYLEYEDGYYKITAKHTRKSLTVKDNKLEEGAEIVQYNYQGLDSQKWVLRNVGLDNLVISLLSNPNLSISIDGSIANGDKLILSETKENNNQIFCTLDITEDERPKANGIYKIAVKADSNKAIEVAGGNQEQNAIVGIWDYGRADWQKFNFEYIEGYYKITAVHTGKSLTVKNNNLIEGTEIVQYDYQGFDSQKWILRTSGTNGWVISLLSNPELSITVDENILNGSKLILSNTVESNNQIFLCDEINKGIDIDNNRYPAVSELVSQLVELHPNWQFEVLYTGIDFYTAVQSEYEYAGRTGNLINTSTYKGAWIAPSPYRSGNWASASYSAIAYFMDTRNFINESDIFQFIDLADFTNSGATLSSIQYQVNGTFLSNYAADVMAACESKNINPYFVLARLFQEQGKGGSATINMNGGDGKLYYNPFNIGAQVGNEVATALEKAKREGWDTMQKGLEGGINMLKSGYIDANQNTLYLNKFDVNPASPGGFYSHQYMQNVSAAYSEARILREAYANTGTLDNTIKFIIPVYENMPATICSRPS